MPPEIVFAETQEQRERLFEFRYRVYVEEMNLDIPGADRQTRRLKDAWDDVSRSLAMVVDGRVVGSLRLTLLRELPEPDAVIRDYAMEPAIAALGLDAIGLTSRFMFDRASRRSRGMLEIIAQAVRSARDWGVRLNYGTSDPPDLPFYKHMGYRTYAPWLNDPTFGPVIPILMLVRDFSWFQTVRSPLRTIAPGICQAEDVEARAWFDRTYADFDEATLGLAPDTPH